MKSIELLNIILTIFKSYKNNSEILEQLIRQDIIHSALEQRYILKNDVFDFDLEKTIDINEKTIEYYLVAKDGCPYKIELFFEKKWYLKSFLFQCQSCFGEDTECSVCGGSGWGVL